MEFEKMNEEYREKNYPTNSFFQTYAKNMLGNQILGMLFAFCMMIGGIYLTYFIYQKMQNPELELDSTVGWIMIAFFAIFSLLMLWLWIVMIKRMTRKQLGSIKMCAKESGYTIEEVEQFEQEALKEDTIILNMAGENSKENRHNAFYGQKDGLLTKNYICLEPGEFVRIMKIEDITGAYLVNQWVSTPNASHLMIYLLSNHNTQTQAFCTESCAHELQNLLKERNKKIETPKEIIDGEKFLKWMEKKKKNTKNQ